MENIGHNAGFVLRFEVTPKAHIEQFTVLLTERTFEVGAAGR